MVHAWTTGSLVAACSSQQRGDVGGRDDTQLLHDQEAAAADRTGPLPHAPDAQRGPAAAAAAAWGPSGILARAPAAACTAAAAAPANTVYALTGATGSLGYMAPEVYRRQQYNHKADVFSFGVLLWELTHQVGGSAGRLPALGRCSLRVAARASPGCAASSPGECRLRIACTRPFRFAVTVYI
jgi:serine/threonine protein kinase